MKDAFVIKVGHGGLGDHLFYSHLPQIAKEAAGYKKVLVSNLSEYRHPDYKKLVWETNPYVDGFCDDDAFYPEAFPEGVPAGMNLLDKIMLAQGLDDGLRWHEPRLYLTTPPAPEVAGATIYDPNYVSGVGHVTEGDIGRFFAKRKLKIDFMLKPRGKGVAFPACQNILETRDLWHYCSLIRSCGRFICLTSGGATLAAALERPALALYGEGQHPMFHHSRFHEYVNVTPPARWRTLRRLARRFVR